MTNDIFAEAVEWQPTLSPERQANVERIAKRLGKAATMFRQTRDAIGLSQVEAAKRLDMTQANISKLENRRADDVGKLRKLVAGSGYEVVVMLRSKDRTVELL